MPAPPPIVPPTPIAYYSCGSINAMEPDFDITGMSCRYKYPDGVTCYIALISGTAEALARIATLPTITKATYDEAT